MSLVLLSVSTLQRCL